VSDPLDHFFIERLALALGAAWFGLLLWNQVVWAFVTLTLIILVVGFVISRFGLGIQGWTLLMFSSAVCGSSVVLMFWLLFRAFA
jgi:hypothetical protein